LAISNNENNANKKVDIKHRPKFYLIESIPNHFILLRVYPIILSYWEYTQSFYLIESIPNHFILLRVYPIILWHQEKKEILNFIIYLICIPNQPSKKHTNTLTFLAWYRHFNKKLRGETIWLYNQYIFLFIFKWLTVSIYTPCGNSFSKAVNTIWIFTFFFLNKHYIPSVNHVSCIWLRSWKSSERKKYTCSNTL
jgi:hypothetical protein